MATLCDSENRSLSYGRAMGQNQLYQGLSAVLGVKTRMKGAIHTLTSCTMHGSSRLGQPEINKELRTTVATGKVSHCQIFASYNRSFDESTLNCVSCNELTIQGKAISETNVCDLSFVVNRELIV